MLHTEEHRIAAAVRPDSDRGVPLDEVLSSVVVAALDAYDRDNPHHKTLIHHTRELTVFGGLWYYKYWEDVYRDAGLDLISSVGRPAVGMIKKKWRCSTSTKRCSGRRTEARLIRASTPE
ncbi:MAG: hypothetical protein ABIP03_14095 [Aquihabitans sp.]